MKWIYDKKNKSWINVAFYRDAYVVGSPDNPGEYMIVLGYKNRDTYQEYDIGFFDSEEEAHTALNEMFSNIQEEIYNPDVFDSAEEANAILNERDSKIQKEINELGFFDSEEEAHTALNEIRSRHLGASK